MLKVAGVWEHGWNLTPTTEFYLWEFPLRTYGVDEWYMSPVQSMPSHGRLLTQVESIESAISLNPDLTPVFVEEDGENALLQFSHPEHALYIFGRAGFSPWKARGSRGVSLRIDTPVGGGMLWPHQCVPLVLQHRAGFHKLTHAHRAATS